MRDVAVPFNSVVYNETTGVACANTGRKFIGIERDDRYFEIAEKRITEAYNKII